MSARKVIAKAKPSINPGNPEPDQVLEVLQGWSERAVLRAAYEVPRLLKRLATWKSMDADDLDTLVEEMKGGAYVRLPIIGGFAPDDEELLP